MRNMTKNKKKLYKRHPKLVAFIILLIAFGVFYGWGSIYYQKGRQIDHIVSCINDPSKKMAKYVVASDPDVTVTDAKLKPLQQYFKENKQAAKQLSANLRKGKYSDQIKLIESGTYFFLFPKYSLRIQVYHPQVETNHAGSTLTVDKESFGRMEGADQNFYSDLGLIFPGRYHLLVKTKVSGRKLKADAIVNIWSNKTINMIIKTGTFQIRSVPYGVVYINDRKVKTLDKYGRATFKNYPLAKNMELYIKSTYNGKTIKSEKVKDLSSSIETEFSNSDDDDEDYGTPSNYAGNQKQDVYQDVEGDYIVNPIWPGLIDQTEAGQLLYNNYTKPDETTFENGKDNQAYKDLKKQVKAFKKGKKNLKLTVTITKIMPAGSNYSDVSYQLVYKYREKGKKHKKVINYEGAIFHNSSQTQVIKSLGKQIK